MAVEVVMPRLSDSMEEGTVAKWLVVEGTPVVRGQPIVEIDTDKATMEYEAEDEGILLQILVHEGETAAIGTPIARVGSPGEAIPEASTTVVQRDSAAQQARQKAGSTVSQGAPRARASASPVARRLARELGVDLSTVEGTGPNGMISKEDVERAAQEDGAAQVARVEPLSRVQQAVARHMVEAAVVPTFAAEVEIDMTSATTLRESLEPRPSFNDLVVRACALALREHPRVNAAYTEQGFRHAERVNVGIAVAAQDALLVPVVHDADQKSLSEVARESRELADKARAGKLTPAELDGGTFTVSNLGMHGVRRFKALLNTPQAAILAVGAVEARAAVDAEGSLVALPLLSATLVCDHRILYGADAARFLARVRELLENPASL